jgi:hypothetical protein
LSLFLAALALKKNGPGISGANFIKSLVADLVRQKDHMAVWQCGATAAAVNT